MVKQSFRLCRAVGCSNLVIKGYCDKHAHLAEENIKARFSKLNTKKTPEQRAFYQSKEWAEASQRHRAHEPLCRRCKEQGRITPAALVHHNPPLQYLINNNLNPCDDRYLESLCFNCHQKELSNKQTNSINNISLLKYYTG